MRAAPLGSCVTRGKMPPFSEPWILIYHTGGTGTQPRLLKGGSSHSDQVRAGQGPNILLFFPFLSHPYYYSKHISAGEAALRFLAH